MNYNECIKRLMVNDRTEKHKTCVDKLAARSLVPERHRVPLIYAEPSPRDPGQYPCVIKCSHDSGSSRVLLSVADYHAAKPFIERRLTQTYGVNKGEWAYQYAKPMVMAENLLPDATDYKFHISGGRVRWVQVITDRILGAKETIFDSHGNVIPHHFDDNMRHHPCPSVFPGSEAWRELTELALQLADGFRYVRIDLYYCGQPYFGEFTFWPRAGNYGSKHLDFYGDLLCSK